ncbi:uncharacterized protein LOC129592283 [Paramacrobiotus metropolitanus]|uniref:uncharacterized protein LOC129592283 n=1 Tax=Paramacrobiotus metropolitanus TaxID=2943436 RepID=UPI002445D88B|nr:uncharacterized protein LOC129592283 [Paramacrobiotus metropolitanus]XP_055344254.1 uncharacterized protein LOC129592283 [Paramacrobiotus metropolitanus]
MSKTSVSSYCIRQQLCAAGRTAPERNQKKYGALRPVVLGLFKQGWSNHAIKKHVKARTSWVEEIIRDAGLTHQTRTTKSSPFKCTDHGKHAIVTIKKRHGVWRISRREKRKAPWAGLDWTIAEDAHTSATGNESRSIMSIAMDNLYWEEIRTAKEDAKLRKAKHGIAGGGSAVDGHKQTSGSARELVPEQLSAGQVKQEDKVSEPSFMSPGRFAETPPVTVPFPEENSTMSGRYQCQVCRLSWDNDEAFLLHLADKVHELRTAGNFLYCTGCKFRSRKPVKAGRHVIKYQSRSAWQNYSLHSVKALT